MVCYKSFKNKFPIVVRLKVILLFIINSQALFIRFGLISIRYATVAVFVSDLPCVHTLQSILRSVVTWLRFLETLSLRYGSVTYWYQSKTWTGPHMSPIKLLPSIMLNIKWNNFQLYFHNDDQCCWMLLRY